MTRSRNIEFDIEAGKPCSGRHSWAGLAIWCTISYICMLIVFIRAWFPEFSLLKLGLLPFFVQGNSPAPFYAFSESQRHYAKPKGIEIVALVPFHEPSRTEILDCYLQSNLASTGGFLDRVVFMPHTNNTGNLQWLDSKVDGTSSYAVSETGGLSGAAEDTLFVWIDGDVVFLENHTIPTLVKTKLDRPNAQLISANVVNQAALACLHSHPSIALPYLPELKLAQPVNRNTWRASDLPLWKGLAEFQVDAESSHLSRTQRWLPADQEAFDKTPIGRSISSDDGPGLGEWTVKAQQHYSFLHHLELGDLHRYRFPLWDNPESISASFFCFMGRDAGFVETFMNKGSNDAIPNSDGNQSHKKGVMIDGKGLVAQYDSDHRSQGLDGTDVLQRYRSYAREMVCK